MKIVINKQFADAIKKSKCAANELKALRLEKLHEIKKRIPEEPIPENRKLINDMQINILKWWLV